jgi:hypothetical protein
MCARLQPGERIAGSCHISYDQQRQYGATEQIRDESDSSTVHDSSFIIEMAGGETFRVHGLSSLRNIMLRPQPVVVKSGKLLN